MNPAEQNAARYRQPVMAVGGGIAAALVIATLPHVYLENIIGATGLSEIIPAAAPPLGNTARGLVTVVAGLITTSALYLFLNHQTKNPEGGSDMSLAIRKNLTVDPVDEEQESRSRFAAEKLGLAAKSLTKFLKKPKKRAGQVTELRDLPKTRSADHHPDAPARHPIIASSDLGRPLTEKIKPFDPPEDEHESPQSSQSEQSEQSSQSEHSLQSIDREAPPSFAAASFVADKSLQSPPADVSAQERVDEDRSQQEPPTPAGEDLSSLSLVELTDRLEAGLRRLNILESSKLLATQLPDNDPAQSKGESAPPVSATEAPPPVAIAPLRSVDSNSETAADSRQANMDAALKAALGTLEKMTIQR